MSNYSTANRPPLPFDNMIAREAARDFMLTVECWNIAFDLMCEGTPEQSEAARVALNTIFAPNLQAHKEALVAAQRAAIAAGPDGAEDLPRINAALAYRPVRTQEVS
jgi:hypothetical protein